MIDTARLWRDSPLAVASRRFRRASQRLIPATTIGQLIGRLWWPIEAGNELGALAAQDTGRPYPSYVPDRAANDLAIALRAVQRRVTIQRALIVAGRTVWLALLVTLVLLALRFLTPVPDLVILVAVGVVALLGYVYHRSHPVTVWTAARLLDRHARLDEQLTTALELAITPAPVRLAARQVVGAQATMKRLQAERRFRPRVPWTELQMAVSMGVIVAGLALVAGPTERLAPPRSLVDPTTLNPELMSELDLSDPAMRALLNTDAGTYSEDYQYLQTTGVDPNAELTGVDSEALRQAAELSNRSAKELEALAEALKDASLTAQAAQDLRAGNYQSAAQQITDLAKSLENLSPQARADLAARLQQAAQNVQPMDPELARRLEQAAKALASRSDRAAAQGLEDLSKAISDTGKNVLSQQQLAEALERMGQADAAQNDDGPPRDGASESGAPGEQGMLGEGEAGEFGFGLAESTLAIPVAAGQGMQDDGSGGTGAGQGQGSAAEQYQARLSPDQQRIVAPVEQAPGPTAPRLGNMPPGSPESITAGPGTTGPGNVAQGGLPITTGLDANRVPRGQRSVVEGYFKNQKEVK